MPPWRARFYLFQMNTMAMGKLTKELSSGQQVELIRTLKTRFEQNMNRHKGLEWAKVHAKLVANTEKLYYLNEMEQTGGETNPEVTITVIPNAVPAHLAHGDTLGPCENGR